MNGEIYSGDFVSDPEKPPRPTAQFAVSPLLLNLAVAAVLILFYNRTFLARATDLLPARVYVLSLGMAAFFLTFALVSLLAGPYPVRLQKLMLCALMLICALTSFFTDRFGVLYDPQMVQNLTVARMDEAGDLLSGSLIAHLTLYGGLPIFMILSITVKQPRVLPALGLWIASVFTGLLACTAIILSQYSTFASYRTPQRDPVLLALHPFSELSAAYTALRLALEPALPAPAPIATDASRSLPAGPQRPPLFVLMVVGESARAANFGLGGYARDTTPELAAREVIYFPQTTACGTATAVSVPCMFSPLSAKAFTISKNRRIENVLDVAARIGLDVHWIENDREFYGVADRIPVTNFADNGRSDACPSKRCPDEILLPDLMNRIATAKTDTLLVVHLVGSHMVYSDRYPPSFETFAPVCHGTDLSSCPRQDLVNGYDNSIRYTDHVLARMIDALAARPDLATAMVYTSDHGESLGEHGLFAHSTPPLLAPAEQTRVPFLMWLSDPYTKLRGFAPDCIRARTATPASHDNIFHTLLGLAGIETTARDPALDLTDGCAAPPA